MEGNNSRICNRYSYNWGWLSVRVRWTITLSLTSKLGLIPNIFKDLRISKGLQKFIISPYTKKKKKLKRPICLKQTFKISPIIIYFSNSNPNIL